jgi:hypothetical protein
LARTSVQSSSSSPTLGFLDALGAAARHRLRVPDPLGLEALLGLAQPPAAALLSCELRRQLVPASVAVELVLGGVDCQRLLDDLARELLVVEVLVARRVRVHLRPVHGDHPDLRQSAPGAQREHLTKQASDRVLVALDEPRDGGVIGPLLRSDNPERNVLLTGALDHPR